MELFKEKLTAFATILLVVLCAPLLRAQIHDTSLTERSDGGFNKEPTSNQKFSHFELTFGSFSLFPLAYGSSTPIQIKNDTLFFTYPKRESNASDTIHSKQDDLVYSVKFRQSSTDSIIQLVKSIHDTEVYRCNICIIDGGGETINIKYNRGKKLKKIRFEMVNTFDPTAYKIVQIINPYLLKGERININHDWEKEQADCDQYMKKLH